MSCHHIPSVRCPECADNRPSMGYWPTPCGTCATLREENARLAEARASAEAEVGKARDEVKRCYETLEEQREVNDKAWAEVARLEGLILDWVDRIPNHDSIFHSVASEARHIRAQRGECRHAGRQQGETPCPDCSAQREEGK